MSARYCKRKGCPINDGSPCNYLNNGCSIGVWDIDRERGNKPKPPPPLTLTPTEAEEQEELCAWCDAKGIKIVHIPNERKCSAAMAASLARQGMRKGFPDNFIVGGRKGFCGLFIELKRAKKSLSRVSPEQREWIRQLNEAGYKAVICYGAEEAKRVISEYFRTE